MINSMSRIVLILGLLLTTPLFIQSQEVDLKQLAIEEFKNERYPEAISLLKDAVAENPNDAEIWFYLGFYTHYLCNDWIPLSECDEERSDEILDYLDKAVTLNPKYGNAYYFIGVEHGSRSLRALLKRDIKKMRVELLNGRNKGGYPDWLIEYARNMLNSCEPNAILFTGGDPDTWPTLYLQYCENFRTDVTVIPLSLLNRPWYVMKLKRGIKGVLKVVPISWREEQILDMHPYKLISHTLEISVPLEELERYGIFPEDSLMIWELETDLKTETRTLLSAEKAVLTDIIKTNRWENPLYFSIACSKNMLGDLDRYLQLCGLTNRLLPVESEKYGLSINHEVIETHLLNPENYTYFMDIKECRFVVPG